MSKYLVRANYVGDGVKGLLTEGGTKRRDAARAAIESGGGTLECMYYAFGDTDVFGDMALIAEQYGPHVSVLPIGDFYTMGPDGAAHAVRLLGATQVLCGHFGTFPALDGTPARLREPWPRNNKVLVRRGPVPLRPPTGPGSGMPRSMIC